MCQNNNEIVKMTRILLANAIISVKILERSDKDKRTLFKSGSGLYSIPYIHCFSIINKRERDYNLSVSILTEF